MKRRCIAATLALTYFFAVGAKSTVWAGTGSDIPGAPWPGGITSATVGGATYDQVWRLVLPSGRVAVLRLEGETGAELGLYIFDYTASSVSVAQPLAQSARPGGNQQLRVTLPAGTYYLDVNGRNVDRAYFFTLAVVLLPDDTPPELTVTLPSNGNRVNDPNPLLLANASDSLSDVTEMRWQRIGDLIGWSAWQPYRRELTVSIPDDEGPYSLLVEVRNGLGLVSSPGRIDLFLDRTMPLASPIGALRSGLTGRSIPSLEVQFSEAMAPASWRSGVRLFDVAGSAILGTATYDMVTQRGRFIPANPLVLGRTYALQIGVVADLAGNRVLPGDGWSFAYKSRTFVTAAPSAVKVKAGSTQVLRATSSGVPSGAPIELQRYVPTSSGGNDWEWVRVATATVRGGSASLQFNPDGNAKYRVRYLGDAKRQAANSKPFSLAVSPDLRISGGGGIVRVRTSGQIVSVRGLTTPAELPVNLVRYRCNSSWSSCSVVDSVALVSGIDGSFMSQWTAARGYWGFRIRFAASEGLNSAESTLLRFEVP